MRNQGQLILGVAVILIGVLLLIGNVLDVDVWNLCWPTAIIVLGLVLLFRPQLLRSSATSQRKLIGDIRRRGDWQVTDEEFWLGVGDVRLDMTEAEISPGETHIRVTQFVGDVRVVVPQAVGVLVVSSGFIVDARVLGQKREAFLSPVRMASDDYETAERRVRLEISSFVGDVRVKRV